jgi:hypothetical protein
MAAAKFAKRANTPGYCEHARAWKSVQGLRQGLRVLRAPPRGGPVQGLRCGPVPARAPGGPAQGLRRGQEMPPETQEVFTRPLGGGGCHAKHTLSTRLACFAAHAKHTHCRLLHTPSTLSPAAHAENTVACCAVLWCGTKSAGGVPPQECGAERARCCCTEECGAERARFFLIIIIIGPATSAAPRVLAAALVIYNFSGAVCLVRDPKCGWPSFCR